MATAKWKLRIYLVVYCMAATTVILVLCEGVARIAIDRPEFSMTDFYGVAGPGGVSMVQSLDEPAEFIDRVGMLLRSDRQLLWVVQPNADFEASALSLGASMVPISWTVRTDSLGGRIATHQPSSESSDGNQHEIVVRPVIRVLVLGDSSSFGWGVDVPYGSLIDSYAPEQDVTVDIRAVPGYSSTQGLAQLSSLIDERQYDVVILAFGANDGHQVRIDDQAMLKSRRRATGGFIYWASRLHMIHLIQSILPSNSETPDSNDASPSLVHRVSPDVFEQNHRHMVDQIRNHGARPILLSVCANDPWHDALNHLSETLNLPLVDGRQISSKLGALVAQGEIPADIRAYMAYHYSDDVRTRAPELYLSPDRCHPTPWFHHEIARHLAPLISSELTTDASPPL